MVNIISAQAGVRLGPSTFDLFPKLPPELRFMIWEQAFLAIANKLPRDWEILLRDSEDGGAVVVESDRKDMPPTHGQRDLYIQDLRMASREASYCLMNVFTPAPCLVRSELRYTIGLPSLKRVWLSPEKDQWMFNFEFNSLGDNMVPLPIFEEWINELEECDHPTVLQNSLAVLGSIRHLRIGFWAFSGYTEHELDLFLMSLPQLSRISIFLEEIPLTQVPDKFQTMAGKLGADFSFENRHIAAHCFFQELSNILFRGGLVQVPKSATKDIVVPDKEILISSSYRNLRQHVYEDLVHASQPPSGAEGLSRDDMLRFIDRWVALGERGVERVMVTRVTSTLKHFGPRPQWHTLGGGWIFASPKSLLQPFGS